MNGTAGLHRNSLLTSASTVTALDTVATNRERAFEDRAPANRHDTLSLAYVSYVGAICCPCN